jgi:hypothetical protein
LGIGPELNFHNVDGLLGVRVGANFFGFDVTPTIRDITYHGHVRLESGGATLDLYPFHTGFRMSAGFKIDGNEVTVDATSPNTISVGGRTYQTGQVGSLSGRATYNTVVPYLGLGYEYRLFGFIPLAIDIGAIYQGEASLNLSASGILASNATFQQDLANESGRVRHYLNYARFYPVVQLSVGYKF